MNSVKEGLTEQFSQLSLKDVAFKVLKSDVTSVLEELQLIIRRIDRNLDIHNLSAKSIAKLPSVKKFIDDHNEYHPHYVINFRKCKKPSCVFPTCSIDRAPSSVVSELHPFPLPIPRTDDHYYDFDSVWGKKPEDQHRPSLSPPKSQRQKKTKDLPSFTVRAARRIIKCGECDKHRVIYAQNEPEGHQQERLDSFLESDYIFSCGADFSSLPALHASDDGKRNVIAPDPSLRCADPIEKRYYAAKKGKKKRFPPICWRCGVATEEQKEAKENPLATKGALPVCEACTGVAPPGAVSSRVVLRTEPTAVRVHNSNEDVKMDIADHPIDNPKSPDDDELEEEKYDNFPDARGVLPQSSIVLDVDEDDPISMASRAEMKSSASEDVDATHPISEMKSASEDVDANDRAEMESATNAESSLSIQSAPADIAPQEPSKRPATVTEDVHPEPSLKRRRIVPSRVSSFYGTLASFRPRK
jgi:hypothetical protein